MRGTSRKGGEAKGMTSAPDLPHLAFWISFILLWLKNMYSNGTFANGHKDTHLHVFPSL